MVLLVALFFQQEKLGAMVIDTPPQIVRRLWHEREANDSETQAYSQSDILIGGYQLRAR